MIKKTPITEAYVETLYCNNCDSLMYRDNIVLTTWPEQYSYYCPVCGSHLISTTLYSNPMRSASQDMVVKPQ